MAGGEERGTRAVVTAMVTNGVLAAAKLAAFLVTGASSLLAEGLHSGAASGHQALLLLGGRRAKAQAGAEAPVGSGRERYFWPFVVGIVLFTLAAVAAIDEGLGQIRQPEAIDDPTLVYGVLGVGIVLVAWSLRTAVGASNRVRGRATWTRFTRSARSPELPVVLLQGVGAMVGLLIALGTTVTAQVTDEPEWDGYGTVAIGVLLALTALVLVSEVRSLLIGASATRKDVEAITAAIEIDPAVRRLLSMRTQHQGPGEVLVGAKVELDHTLTFPEVCEVVNRIERNVRANVPVARAMFIEPDVTDERRAAPTIDEHDPGHDVPEEVRAAMAAVGRRGALGEGIPVEPDGWP